MINQGYTTEPTVLSQDNLSTIKLLESTKSNSKRTRRIDRYTFLFHLCSNHARRTSC